MVNVMHFGHTLRGVVADSTLLAEDEAKTGGAVVLGKTREADG